jgi:hypothetical protein
MADIILRLWVWQTTARAVVARRVIPDDSGEGVISAAIAVLIMAFLGVALWIAFKGTLQGATNNVNKQVTNIGQ